MAKLIFENISLEDAKTFAHWYEGQGEQDAEIWFDIHSGKNSPQVDVHRKDCITVKNNEVIVYLKDNNE